MGGPKRPHKHKEPNMVIADGIEYLVYGMKRNSARILQKALFLESHLSKAPQNQNVGSFCFCCLWGPFEWDVLKLAGCDMRIMRFKLRVF